MHVVEKFVNKHDLTLVNCREIESGFYVRAYNAEYYINDIGQIHRENGPAVVYTDGWTAWYINGTLHRENGPAIESKHGERYYNNGKLHRLDGGAIVHEDGRKEYFVNGIPMTKKFKRWASKKKLEAQDDDFFIFVFENNMNQSFC